jgi:uncharacterized membrane protein HdeD (DUF308 family)
MTHIDRSHGVGEVDGIHAAWGWFVALGAVFIALGLIASGHLLLATLVTVYYLGAAMILAGALQITQSFRLTHWGGFILWLLSGILYVAAGAATFMNPSLASSAMTLVLALFTAASGIMRIWLGAGAMSERGWGWIVASGVLSTAVGLLVLVGWPLNSTWLLGLVLSIDLIFQGCALIGIGFRLRSMN